MKIYYLFHMLRSDEQKEDTKNCVNIMNSYGEMKSGNSKQGCNSKFDAFLSENKVTHVWHRRIINEVEEGEEEEK